MLAEARGISFSAAGVTGSREKPDVGAGNWTQVLYKSSVCSLSLSPLSSPRPGARTHDRDAGTDPWGSAQLACDPLSPTGWSDPSFSNE